MRAFASEVQVQDIHLFRVGRSVQRCPQPVTLYIICSLLETSNFSLGLIALYWDVPPPCTWCATVQYALSVVNISFGVDCFILRRRTPLHMMCEYAMRCQYSFTLNYRDVSSLAHDMHPLCNNVLQCTVRGPQYTMHNAQCTVRGPHLFLAAWPGAAPETGGRIHLLQCINAICVCPLYVQCNPILVLTS